MAADYGFTIAPRKGLSSCYFKKVVVSGATFGSGAVDTISPDIVVNVNGINNFSLSNETSGSVVEVSFGGYYVEDELDGSLTTKFLLYQNRTVSTVWFKLKSGSPATISIRAW